MQPFVTRTVAATRTLTVNLTVQVAVLLFLVGLVLWTLLFTPFANVHDPLHSLRHALYLVPCH